MAIHDSNPERRNLSLLSICIIIYYAAGGQLIDKTVRLQVVNVTFSKPDVLAYFVWGILCWFCFRYWLLNRAGWKEELFKEMVATSNPRLLLYKHLVKKFNLSDDFTNSYHEDKHWVKLSASGPLGLTFQHIYKSESGSQRSESKKIETLLDYFYVIAHAITMFFRKPTLSGYFVPYVLFTTAVFVGVQNRL